MVSRSISHYRVLRKLGEGGMGEVYLAEDTRLSRQVALKVLPPDFAADEGRVRRFMLEAKAASALNHPNILTVYDIGDSEDSRYIATELVNGETLRSRMRRTPFSLRESVDVAMQVASALNAAHGAGIIHRDIKPENIMVRPDGLVKVLDFGLAKLLAPVRGAADSEAETLAKGMTRPGSILGTLQYMSPEQVRGQSLDARSDIFSLGAVLYEMLTGKGLFDKPTQGDVIAAILMEAPSLSDLPPQLQSIVARSLQKDKAKRYQTSQELLLDLKRLNRELELSDQPVAVAPQTQEVAAFTTRTLRTRRFSLLQTLAILLLACLALSAVWWVAVRRPPPTSLKIIEIATWRSAPGEGYSGGSFSPDGSRVAFVTNIGGVRNISVKQTAVNDSRGQTIKDESYTDQPIWSPDGEEIAYFSTRGNQYGLWRVAYLSGSPALIKNVPAADTKPRYWSKGGALYYEARQNLFTLDIKSGQTTQLTSFDSASTSAYSLNISPDEKQIVYIAVEGEKWGVWTMPARGGAARQIVNSAAEIRNAIWHSDSRRVLYSALVDGVFQIFVTDTDASQPAQITFGDTDSFVLDVATDGVKILYGSSKEESDVWRVSLTGDETALTSDINSELWPSVAPDSKTVAYLSVKNLSQGDKLASGAILLRPTHSEVSPTQLVAGGFMPVWSPDSKQVAFMREVGGVYNIWAIQAVGGEARQLTNGGVLAVSPSVMPYNRTQTSDFGWSPDGRRIVYRSKKSGAPNLWLVSADGANDTQVTDNRDSNLRYYSPLWSSDGKHLAYTSRPDNAVDGKMTNGVWVVDVETRTAQMVFQTENFLRLLGWSEDGKGLVVASLKGKPSAAPLPEISIAETTIASGVTHTPITLQSAYLYNIHLSADGRMIAYVGQQDGKDNLYTMPTGGGAPKKLTVNTDARLYFSSLAWSPDGKAIYFGKQWRHSLLSMISNFK
jgi:serine/threonine protein kinase/Tol biopolymer transport system component